MTERYLVTGCAGFIASKVADLLLDAGHEVVGIDNLNDAYDPRLKRWRLEQLRGRPGFSFHETDITDLRAMEQVFQKADERPPSAPPSSPPFAAVVNLAARAGVRPSVENPWIYYQVNCIGTLNLLEMCRRTGVPKFVLASTSSLYGKHNPMPFREDADTNRPLSPYAASKKAAETLAFSYHHLHGIDVSIPRYFTVYGPAGRPDMSVFRFIRRIAEGEPILVMGDGSQSRDFTFIDDIARGTIAAIRPLGYEIINLGGDRQVRLDAVIDQIVRLTGGKLQDRPPSAASGRRAGDPCRPVEGRLGCWIGGRRSASRRACGARSNGTRDNREFARQLDLGDQKD